MTSVTLQAKLIRLPEQGSLLPLKGHEKVDLLDVEGRMTGP